MVRGIGHHAPHPYGGKGGPPPPPMQGGFKGAPGRPLSDDITRNIFCLLCVLRADGAMRKLLNRWLVLAELGSLVKAWRLPRARRSAGGRCEASDVSSKVVARNLEHAAEALKTGPVRRMDLRYRKIGDRGAASLAEILQENCTLEKLELDFNGISSGGAACLAEVLTMNSTLTHLYLCNNSIDDEGAIHLAAALETGCGLTQLYLAGNRITNRGGQAILAALKKSGAVVDIDLSFQGVPDDCIRDIRAALLANAQAKAGNKAE
eukprot:symbB.v1.2.035745.t1/scaffold4882.1/size33489/1